MMKIDSNLIEQQNETQEKALQRDYAALVDQLSDQNIDADLVLQKINAFSVAIPSWGVGTGGTRFARFPGEGEPRHIFDKLDDCGVIQQLTKSTNLVSLHIPWDKADPADLKTKAEEVGLSFDAMNSNSFQDQEDQPHVYKFGSLSHTRKATRKQAIEHNLECIEIGEAIGSKALTIWVGDGSNFPGQVNFTRQFELYLESVKETYACLPSD